MSRFGQVLKVLSALLPLSACSPANLLNAVVPDDGYLVHEDLSYGEGERRQLDIYQPEGAEAGAPVVVYFYGGSWKRGSRETYRFMGEALARRGFVVVVPDYRLYPEVRFPAFVEDGAQALSWVHARIGAFGGDPERIVLMGHSAGAHIAALLAYDRRYLERARVPSSALAAFLGLAGPYAFDPLAYRSTRPIFATVSEPDQARPIAFVDGESLPALLLHGADDRTVLPRNTQDMAARIAAAGGEVRVREYAGTGHVGLVLSFAAPFRGRDQVYEDALAFLDDL